MANYQTDRMDQFVNNAPLILGILSGQSMGALFGNVLDCGTCGTVISPMRFVEVQAYKKPLDDEAFFHWQSEAVCRALSSFFMDGCAVGFFLTVDGKECRLYFANEAGTCPGFESFLRSGAPEFSVINRFLDRRELLRRTTYGGIILNLPIAARPWIDGALEQLSQFTAVVGFLARPLPARETDAFYRALTQIQSTAEAAERLNITYGEGSRRVVSERIPAVGDLNEYLKELLKRRTGHSELWETCLIYGADSFRSAHSVGTILAGALNASASGAHRCLYFHTQKTLLSEGQLKIPSAVFDQAAGTLPAAIAKNALADRLSSPELAALIQLPLYGHPGIRVQNSSTEPSAAMPFSANAASYGDTAAFFIGKLTDTGEPVSLPLAALNEHALITGATGSGKTNTVMNLVAAAAKQGVPVCIIEPSKKDYWLLQSVIPELDVYSAGQDAKPLRLNPFVPEDGVILANHIDSLMYAFSGAFSMETPTKLAMSGLLKFVYERFGWKLGETYHTGVKICPEIEDMVRLLPDYMDRELKYGKEVSGNIRGSLLNRLKSLSEGSVGSIIRGTSSQTIDGKRLCAGPILVELDDLPIDVKPFITELLLIKMSQYLRRQEAPGRLKNLVFLEEAHNVFSRIGPAGQETSKSITSSYFSNMLSEIREYGTGIVIADQGASQIHENAVANTKLKIMHATTKSEDVEAEAFALRLDEYQKRLIPEFRTGEAVVSLRGQPEVWRVTVNRLEPPRPRNTACLFCGHRFLCGYREMEEKLQVRDAWLPLAASDLLSNQFDVSAMRSALDAVVRQYGLRDSDSLCLLGYLLDRYAPQCGGREKRKILFRYNEG